MCNRTATTYLHLNGASPCHHLSVLQSAPHNHDGIVQRAVCLINELHAAMTNKRESETILFEFWGCYQ
jgi:hypothetical protein